MIFDRPRLVRTKGAAFRRRRSHYLSPERIRPIFFPFGAYTFRCSNPLLNTGLTGRRLLILYTQTDDLARLLVMMRARMPRSSEICDADAAIATSAFSRVAGFHLRQPDPEAAQGSAAGGQCKLAFLTHDDHAPAFLDVVSVWWKPLPQPQRREPIACRMASLYAHEHGSRSSRVSPGRWRIRHCTILFSCGDHREAAAAEELGFATRQRRLPCRRW